MLFFRELIAFCQLTIIPGLLIIALIRPSFSKFRTMLILPGISLLVNYVFAGIALLLGIFTPFYSGLYTSVLWLSVIWMWRKEIASCCRIDCVESIESCRCSIVRNLKELFFTERRGKRVLSTIALVGCAGSLTVLFFWFFDNIDTIFLHWDSVLSWNTWAKSWAAGEFPGAIGEYPQLLPINWAVAYHLIGEPIQFVPRAAICLIPFCAALFFFDYGIAKKNIAMLLSVPLLAFYMHNVSYFSHGGELDMLMVYYGAATLFIILYAKDAGMPGEFFRTLLPGILIVCAAGATKQAGLYLLFAFPVTAFFILRKSAPVQSISKSKLRFIILVSLLLIGIVVTPGYVISISRTRQGKNRSNLTLVTHQIYGKKTLFERFLCSGRLFMLRFQSGTRHIASARHVVLDKSRGFGFMLWKLYHRYTVWGIMMVLFNIFVIISCWKIPEYRGILIQTVIFFLIWSMFFCYDLRNLSLVISYIALLTAVAIDRWCSNREVKLPLWYVVPVIFLLIFSCTPEKFLPGSRRGKFNLLQLDIGEPELNRQLLDFARENKFDKNIITDYAYIRVIPGLNSEALEIDLSMNLDQVTQGLIDALKQPEYGALLLPDYASEDVKKTVKEYEITGRLKKDFHTAGYTLYVIVR